MFIPASKRSDTDKAWLAGFIDGEGTVSLQSALAGNHRNRYWTPFVTVTNTHLETLQEIQRQWGGHMGARLNRRPGWRDCYTLRWSSAQARVVLTEVFPFLKVKRANATLVLQFLNHILSIGHPGRRGHPQEVFIFRRDLVRQVRALNQQGRNLIRHAVA